MQTPLTRSHICFDLWDHVLDVVVRPDGAWRWEDEDEFADALHHGLLTRVEAAAVRAEGERLVANLDAVLPTGFEDWRPDPGWPPLRLPACWEQL